MPETTSGRVEIRHDFNDAMVRFDGKEFRYCVCRGAGPAVGEAVRIVEYDSEFHQDGIVQAKRPSSYVAGCEILTVEMTGDIVYRDPAQ